MVIWGTESLLYYTVFVFNKLMTADVSPLWDLLSAHK